MFNTTSFGKKLALITLIACSHVQALEYDWSSFATLSMGKQDGSNVRYLEYNKNLSLSSDTKIGGQLDLEINDQWSFTTQAVIESYTYTPDRDYRPALTAAYFRYRPNAANLIRFGLLRTPHYYFSEYTKVGTAYPWARLPHTVYDKTFDSLDSQYSLDYIHYEKLAGWFVTTQLSIGEPIDGETLDGEFTFKPSIGLNLSVERNDLTLRFGQNFTTLNVHNKDLESLVFGLRAFESVPGVDEFGILADEMSFEDIKAAYTSLSLVWEPGQWAIYAEIYNLSNNSRLFHNSMGSYISFLYQIDRFAPYILVGTSRTKSKQDEMDKFIADSVAEITLPPEQLAVIEGLKYGSSAVVKGYETEFDNLALGFRYDLTNTVVVKAQVDGFYVRSENLKRGFTRTGDPSHGQNVYLYSITLDMVF